MSILIASVKPPPWAPFCSQREQKANVCSAKQPNHDPPTLGGVGGTSADIALQAKEILILKKRLHRNYAEHTGQPIEKSLLIPKATFI